MTEQSAALVALEILKIDYKNKCQK